MVERTMAEDRLWTTCTWLIVLWCGWNTWFIGQLFPNMVIPFWRKLLLYLLPLPQLLLYGPSDVPSSSYGIHHLIVSSSEQHNNDYESILFPLAHALGFVSTLVPSSSSWWNWIWNPTSSSIHNSVPIHYIIPLSSSTRTSILDYILPMELHQYHHHHIYNLNIHHTSTLSSSIEIPSSSCSIWEVIIWLWKWIHNYSKQDETTCYFISIEKYTMPQQQQQQQQQRTTNQNNMASLQSWLQQRRPQRFTSNLYYPIYHYQQQSFPTFSFLYLSIFIPFIILPISILFSFPLIGIYTFYYITKLSLQTILSLPYQMTTNNTTTARNTSLLMSRKRRNGIDSVDSSSSTPFFPTTPFGSPSSHTSWYPFYTSRNNNNNNNNNSMDETIPSMKPSQHSD